MNLKNVILEDLSEVKKNLLLLLGANSKEPIKGKLWYQKELFLLSRNNRTLEEEAGFEAYLWGPYSELADSEMDELVQLGAVKQVVNSYILTEVGADIVNTIKKDTLRSEQELIEELKQFLNGLTKEELLLFVYVSYPETIEDAIEFKKLLPKRKELAISMYRKGRVSIGKAAELAGVSVGELIKELQGRKIYRIERR